MLKPDHPDTMASNLPDHPFVWLPCALHKRVLLFFLLLTVALMTAINITNAPLENPTAPLGMVSFQLAGTLQKSQAMLESWNQQAQLSAALNLGIDYLYMFAYVGTISLGCALLAGHLAPRWPLLALLGVVLSWGTFLALLFDAAENYFLIHLLLGDQQALWPTMARWCAIPKFALILAAMVYLAGGGLFAYTLAVRHKR